LAQQLLVSFTGAFHKFTALRALPGKRTFQQTKAKLLYLT